MGQDQQDDLSPAPGGSQARAVMALTHCTDALLTVADEATLLETICHIVADEAGFPLAWVGLAREDEDFSVDPVAAAGTALPYLKDLKVSWKQGLWGNGPTGTAIRTGCTQVLHDLDSQPDFSPWRNMARAFGLESVCSLPLTHAGRSLGALTVYGTGGEMFDALSVRMLEGLAHSLSFGIGAIRMRNAHELTLRDLAESESRYRSLVELSPDAILVHSKGTVLFANLAALDMFGDSQQALVGSHILDLIHDESKDKARAYLQAGTPDRLLIEYRMQRLDGGVFDAEVLATDISFHSLPARILVIRDATNRKQMNEQLIQAAKLATLGEMAAGLVHELSQPLNVIRLSAEGALLFMERGKATNEWQAQQFHQIAEQTQRAAEIIDDIRIFSRRDNSPIQVFDALARTRAALNVMENQMRADGINLVIDFLDEPAPVRGRPVQLEQVILNLVTNAHHALKEHRDDVEKGDSPPTIRVWAQRQANQLLLGVADNGPGIPLAARPRIFEPFFTTKAAGRGTGLGLSVSFGIITGMGGRLDLTQAEHGAEFTLSLPLDHTCAPTASPAAPTSLPIPACDPAPQDAHLMVVEDEVTAGEMLAGNLRALGFRVTLCDNGVQAYQKFMLDPADVVITDLRMPAGGGEQLVQKLRDYDLLQPIIIVTGHLGATERLADNLQDDRCAVLKKPVALGQLQQIINSFLLPPPE